MYGSGDHALTRRPPEIFRGVASRLSDSRMFARMLPNMKMQGRMPRTGVSPLRILLVVAVLAVAAYGALTVWERHILLGRNPRASQFAKDLQSGAIADQAVTLARSEGANVAFVGGNVIVLFPHELPVEVDVVAGKVVSATVVQRD